MADLKVLDLFAGVGGVKQGFEQAGVQDNVCLWTLTDSVNKL